MPRRADSELLANVGANIRAHRDALRWSQTRLAAESQIRAETVSRVECGKLSPSLAVLSALASAMGIGVKDLVLPSQTTVTVSADLDESQLLDEWRRSDPAIRVAVLTLLRRPGRSSG